MISGSAVNWWGISAKKIARKEGFSQKDADQLLGGGDASGSW